MIIVTQKREIINFDNIIAIAKIEEDEKFKIKAMDTLGNVKSLGIYKKEERMNEIHEEIIKKMKSKRYLLKPKARLTKQHVIAAKEYFERFNHIELITGDCNFDIVPIEKNGIIIYEMPEE